ncbi:MAG TPA: carbon monoxide dehydrogenase [Alphaproteobacteria bacterium]|nr:carbon monoxide dehydrogenase [Alphaproteobacteria bacterium]
MEQAIDTRFGSGKAVHRLEDEALLKGHGAYAGDMLPEGCGHVIFLRSTEPHANILSIDATDARAMDGVRLIVTGADLAAENIGHLPGVANFKRPDGSDAAGAPRHILARDRVRFVGEPVVAIVADSKEIAEAAGEAIMVEYEPLPFAITMDEAMAEGAMAIADAPDNIVAATQYGDAAQVDQLFGQAEHVVKLHINNQRLIALTIEPRTVLAQMRDGRLEIRLSSQMPTGIRGAVAGLLGLQTDDVHVLVGDVGGGFGMKTGPYPEDVAVAYCAHRLKSPVAWVSSRDEEFLATYHGRDVVTDAAMALDDAGKILALRVHSRANVGAAPTMSGVAIQALIGPWVQTSVYDIGMIDFAYQAIATNTATTGPYRGAGRPEAIHIIERLMDEAARQTGLDRVALRRKNFVAPSQMPYKNAMGQTYDVGGFESVMDQGLALANWHGFEERAKLSEAKGLWRGLGIATFLEWTGGNALEENVRVSIMDDGVVEVASAINQMGQGIMTSLVQLVVDVFDVAPERIRMVIGDTDHGNGFGSAGSRSLFTGGAAVQVGAGEALDKARALAAEQLEVEAGDLEYAAGIFAVAGTDMKRDLAELAGSQPGGRIEVASSTTAKGPTWPNGCHICEVEIDPETGVTHVAAYASANDVGRVVNPTVVIGQLEGGAVQGIGQALAEEVVYDPEGGQLLTGSLMDYQAPRADIATDLFKTSMDESMPSVNNVLGVKGVGELGTIGATPAVVNAVADALARHGLGQKAADIQMPLTPANLWKVIHG